MKILVISDLHQEFGSIELSFTDVDVVILAGDINLGIKGIEWIKSAIKNIPVIYVLGNHEYYKGSYPKTLNQIKAEAQETNVHVLENDSVVIEDITFHGATLWTDFALMGDSKTHGAMCQNVMNDYKSIRRDPEYSKLRSIDTYQWHHASVRWLNKSLSSSTTAKNIVITHHAPSIKSIPEALKKEIISCAYASNLEALISTHSPLYWIHGHVHTPVQYQIGPTTILCNPHGYIDEPENGFDKKLVLEI